MPSAARRLLALGLSALSLLLLGSAAARAEIYWVNSDTDSIGRATNAGGSVNRAFAPGGTDLGGVTSDGTYLYWAQWFGGIARANLDGSGAGPFIATPSQAGSLATDGSHLYWVVPNEPRISRARLDGSDVEADFVVLDDGGYPDSVATDGVYLYWTDSAGRVGRIRPDGSGRQVDLVTGLTTPTGLAVSGGYLYWADSGLQALGRARTDGSGLSRSWVSTNSVPNGIAVGGGYVYWSQPVAGTINRVTTAGSGATSLISALDWPMALHVTAPGFSGTPASSAYGNVVLGRRATQTFTITNDSLAFAGGQPLTFAAGAVTLTGTNANQFSISADGCAGQTIAPGATCSVEVTFTPTTTGSKSASLRFVDNATSSPQTFALSGRGTQGTASLSSTTGAFGDVRTNVDSGSLNFIVTNSASGANAGPITYDAGAVTLTGADADQFSISYDGCSGTVVAAAGTCDVWVAFAPTRDGAASASLRFADDAPGSPRTIALSGRGITSALSISPATYDFGDVRVNRDAVSHTFTVSSTGNAPVTIPGGAVTLTVPNAPFGADFAIVDDQCSGTTLAAGDDCTVEIRFAAGYSGARSATLDVAGDEASASAALSGEGVFAFLSSAGGSPSFGSVLIGTSSASASFGVFNNGGVPVQFGADGVTLDGDDAARFGIVEDGCSDTTLAIGDDCFVKVIFTPTETDLATARLHFTEDGGDDLFWFDLNGSGIEPRAALALTPSTHDFGSVRVGTTTAPVSLRVANSGTAAATLPVDAVAVAAAGASATFSATDDDCSGTTLDPGEDCTVSVTYAPLAVGAATATVTIDDGDGGTLRGRLSGTGVAPSLRLAPASHEFGPVLVGRSGAPVAFTLANDGTAAATLPAGAASLGGPDPADWTIADDDCSGTTLAAGDDCVVSLVFAPTGAGGAEATLFLEDDEGTEIGAALTGTGVAPAADLALTPPAHDFGSQLVGTTSAPVALRLSNLGTGPATIPSGAVAIDASGATAAFGVADGCSGATLDPGEGCTVSVSFGPQAAGAATASVEIADGEGGTLTATLRGTGIAPSLRLTPTSHDFGSLLVGTRSAPVTVTLANDGSAPATLPADAVALDGAGAGSFAVSADTCSGATLAAGDDCDVAVVFAPVAAGVASATLTVADGDGGTLSATLTGTGAEPRRDPEPRPDPPAPTPPTPTVPAPTPPAPTPPVRRATRRTARPQLTTRVGSGAAAVVGDDGTLTLRCALADATLRGCTVVVSAGGRALGSGSASVRGGTGAASVTVRLGARGRAELAAALGGVRVTVTITATTRDGRRIVKRVRVTLFAKRQQVVTLPGAFEPDGAALTPAGDAFLRDVARRLRGARAIVCTGFTATRGEQGSDEAAAALGLARGRAACALLRRHGVKITLTARSGGRSEPLAGNRDEDGRARNRRVELTITRSAARRAAQRRRAQLARRVALTARAGPSRRSDGRGRRRRSREPGRGRRRA